MTETMSEDRATTKSEQWREWLAAQERSGLSVK
jgi:transposase-like protein